LESLWILYRITGDKKYPDQAWEIFEVWIDVLISDGTRVLCADSVGSRLTHSFFLFI